MVNIRTLKKSVIKVFSSLKNTTGTNVTAFIIVLLILIFLDYWIIIQERLTTWNDLKINIIGEAHGIAFDIIVFGILISLYESRRSNKELILRYFEEIDDFRYWQNEEAAHRIAGIVKRLNRLGVNMFDFTDIYLKNANLGNTDLSNSDFWSANLREAYFAKSKMNYCRVTFGNFSSCNFAQTDLSFSYTDNLDIDEDYGDKDTNFSNAYFLGANLDNVKFVRVHGLGADFGAAKIRKSKFSSCYFESASFNSADLKDTSFIDTNLNYASFRYADLRNTKFLSVEFTDIDLEGAKISDRDLSKYFSSNEQNDFLQKYDTEPKSDSDEYGVYYVIRLKDSNNI